MFPCCHSYHLLRQYLIKIEEMMPFSLKTQRFITFWVQIWNQSPKIYPYTKFELDLKIRNVKFLRWRKSSEWWWCHRKNWRWRHQLFQQFKVNVIHMILLPSFNFIWLKIRKLLRKAILPTLIGKDVLNTLTLLDVLPQEKSKTFCIPVQKAGTTIIYLFKNFTLRHVDNLLCFIFIKDVLV